MAKNEITVSGIDVKYKKINIPYKMFILYKNNVPAAYIPKRAFEKRFVGGVADIIALSLEQR